jgi:hypothetical protein
MARSQSIVALVRTSPESIIADYDRLIALVSPDLAHTPRLLLVAAIEQHLPFPAASTPPWQLEGVGRALQSRTEATLTLNCTHPDPADLHGLRAVADRLSIQTQPDPAIPSAAIWLATLRRTPEIFFGGTVRMMLTQARHSTVLAVIDGTSVGNGPYGQACYPEIGNLLIASRDPIAADAVAARLLGLDPLHDVVHLRTAHERGLGNADISMIELVGDCELANLRWPPHAPQTTSDGYRGLVTELAQALRRRIFGQSAVGAHNDTFNAWSEQDRQRYISWIYDTDWGRLFAQYQREIGHRNTP